MTSSAAETSPTASSNDLSPGDKVVIWQTLASKRAGLDQMMWQTPALGMTAQAFLLTIALAPDSRALARLLSSALSGVLSVMVMQLMAKHRRHEMLDSLLLERLERETGISEVVAGPHGRPSERPQSDLALVETKMRPRAIFRFGFWRMSSYELWMLGLALFAVVALAVLLLTALGASPSVLG